MGVKPTERLETSREGAYLTEGTAFNDLWRHVRVGALQRFHRLHVLDAAHAKVADLGREAMRLGLVRQQQNVACRGTATLATAG